MGSQSQKEKIGIKLFLNILAILMIFPILLEFTAKSGLIKISPNEYLFALYGENDQEESDFLEFLNVGQGDCTLIKSGDSVAVIDFGVEDDGERIYKRLLKLGIKSIDLAVITHHHSDHMGGFLRLAEKMEIKNLLINNSTAKDGEAGLYKRVVALADEKSVKLHLPQDGMSFKIGNAVLEVLRCDASAVEENNRSVAVMLSISGNKVLFTGDGDNPVEHYITDNCNIKCDILKMGHHGAHTASYERFLKAAAPKYAVASCGYDNSYNHPSKWAVLRAEEAGIEILRTDLDRNIRFTFNNNDDTYNITTERGGLE